MERLGGLVLACLSVVGIRGFEMHIWRSEVWGSGGVLEYASTLSIQEVE